MNRGPRRDFDWDYMDQLFPPRLRWPPDREDDVFRRLKETLGEVDKALWIFSYYPDHVYGIAGTKAAPPTPTRPTVSEPANGSSSTSSLQNGSATGCQEDPIPNPEPTCLPALSAASSTASNTYPPLGTITPRTSEWSWRSTAHCPCTLRRYTKDPEADITKFSWAPKIQGLPNGLVVGQPAAHALSKNVNKDNSSISAEKQSSANSLSLTVHTEAKDAETGSNKFSLVPKSQGLMSGRVARPSTSRAPSQNANIENISGSAQHESSSRSSSMTVNEETKSPKAGVPMFSSLPKSHGLPSGLAVRPPIARPPSKDANKESISGSAQHHSSTNYSSLMVHKETKSTEAGTTKFSSVRESQEIPSGLVVRPPNARAPCEDVNKENSSVSAQKQFSADYLSVGKHTETKHSEAHRTWFSSVSKGQGLTSGLVVRPPTGRAPFKDVSKENSSFLAQKQSSIDFSTPMVRTETNDPKADRTKISMVPRSQGLSSTLVTPAPTAGAPFMNANKENHSASAQHESYTSKSSPTVHSERKRPEPGSTECSSMSTSSASFGQSGVLPGQEDELARRVQDALGDVNVALWLFANHRGHLYGLAGNKVAQQTRAPPTVGKPINGRSSTSSMRNDNAMDPGGTRSSSSNRSSTLSREQQHSNRASSSGCHESSGGSTHPASQSGTRNQQQSSAYGPSSSHFSRHDSSRHTQNHHPRQQQLHLPQSLMDGQYKPSNAYSSSATGSKNSRHSAQPLRGSWLQPHQSRGSSSKQGLLGNPTSNPKKRPLPSSSAASSAASTTNSPVPSSSQEPRNDLGVRPPAKRARRL
ncbi:hypothetical protein MRX96_047014 [Rhipicephalus microplus]